MRFITSWRGLFWCLIAATTSSRSYMNVEESVAHADKLLKAFDERFDTSDGTNILERPRPAGR